MKNTSLPNFDITSAKPLSTAAINAGINNYHTLINYIKNLPYGRIKNIDQIFIDQKGTCSTKHAALKLVADEQGVFNIKLMIGIYKMNVDNTPGIGDVLQVAELDYLLEAHCYLSYLDQRFDYTTASSDITRLQSDIIHEIDIKPSQIGPYKAELHRSYLDQWRAENKINLSLDDLWQLREQCIANLST